MSRSQSSSFSRIAESSRQYLATEWRYFLAGLSREKLIGSLKTLAWVVPLTLLIWIYAEREQVLPVKNVAVPIDPIVDSNHLVTVIRPADKNVILDLEGPQAKLQYVLQQIQGGMLPRGLQIEIPLTLGADRNYQITLEMIQNQKIFRDNGVTVKDCQPRGMEVRIDSLKEVKGVRVVAPPDTANLEGLPVFDPPEVSIRGPQKAIDDLMRTGKLTVFANLSVDLNRDPGHYTLPEIPLEMPPALRDEKISITPAKVSANVTIRAAEARYTPDAITIFVTTPQLGDDNLLAKYKVVYKNSLPKVELIGDPKVIEAMQKPGYAPLPSASLKVSESDYPGKRSKTVTYDLPAGVRVSDKDKDRKVEFELVKRTPGAPTE